MKANSVNSYNFYKIARKVELDAAQLYLASCEAMATACTATAPYVIQAYEEAYRSLKERCSFMERVASCTSSDVSKGLEALASAKTYLRIIKGVIE